LPHEPLAIAIPAHLRARMEALHEDRQHQLLMRGGLTKEQRTEFIRKLRSAGRRQSKRGEDTDYDQQKVEPDYQHRDDVIDSEDSSADEGCECECEQCQAGNCAECSDPNCADPNCVHENEGEGEEASGGRGKTKAELQLDSLARKYAAAHGVSYAAAYSAVLGSPQGQRIYQDYIWHQRDSRTRTGG